MKRINIEEAEALLRTKNRAKSKQYEKTFNEIKLRQDMVVLISAGDLFHSYSFLSNNDVIIIVNKKDIKIPIHVFCSEQWKENLLDAVELKRGVDKYNKEWSFKMTKMILTSFLKHLAFVGIGLLPIFIKGEMPSFSSVICWSGISLMFLVSILELMSGFNYIKRANRIAKSIRKQLLQNII